MNKITMEMADKLLDEIRHDIKDEQKMKDIKYWWQEAGLIEQSDYEKEIRLLLESVHQNSEHGDVCHDDFDMLFNLHLKAIEQLKYGRSCVDCEAMIQYNKLKREKCDKIFKIIKEG